MGSLIEPVVGTGGGASVEEIDACCYVDATSGTPIILGQTNVSSITDSGVGIYAVNFSNALASANYSWGGMASREAATSGSVVIYENGTTRSTTTLPIRTTVASNSTPFDQKFSVIVVGA